MRRRDFMARIGGAALGWPLAALAQQPAKPVIGFLGTGLAAERAQMVDWFRGGLKQGGYVAGKDVAIEYRWAEGSNDRLPGLAAELVSRKVAVIATSGGPRPALAADRKSTRLNSSHIQKSRMPSSA